MNLSKLAILFILFPAAATAGLLRVESTSAYAMYRADDLSLQQPFFEFFKGTYNDAKQTFQLDTNFAVNANDSIDGQQFNLYALDGEAWLLKDRTKVMFGRSFFTHMTVRPRVLDSLSLEHFMFNKQIRVGAYLGVERPPENLTVERSKVYGVNVGYVSPNQTPMTANLRFEHQIYDVLQRDRMKGSINQPIDLPWGPELLLDVERDVTNGLWSRSEAGVDFYPTYRSTFGFRYQIYELDPITQVDDPILNVISQGETRELSGKVGYFLTHELYVSYSYAQDTFPVQSNYTGYGEKHQLGIDLSLSPLRLNFSTYRITSYGGWVQGERGVAGLKLGSRLEINAMCDYSYYQKVTSSARNAISNQLGLTYFLDNSWNLDVIGEWNVNNASSQDQRFFLKLTYLTWKET